MMPSHFCDLENRPAKELAPGVRAKTFWGDKMLLSQVEFTPGAAIPNHSHPHEQSGVLLAGEMTMTIAGESRILRPGDMYVIPGGVEHSAIAHNGACTVLDIFCPVREEYKY